MFIKLTNPFASGEEARATHLINSNHIVSITVLPPVEDMASCTELLIVSGATYYACESPDEILRLIDREHERLAALWINTQVDRIEQGVPA